MRLGANGPRSTLVMLGGLGPDVSGETVPYLAGWGEDGALEAVTQFAQLIDTLARRVEAALSYVDNSPPVMTRRAA